ncbi:MAG: hypothetical protein HRK26_00250 [Rickettsiaceae bacterium H1]|nr:hypothetical protein [Rickettsiaceae bacterium H1]
MNTGTIDSNQSEDNKIVRSRIAKTFTIGNEKYEASEENFFISLYKQQERVKTLEVLTTDQIRGAADDKGRSNTTTEFGRNETYVKYYNIVLIGQKEVKVLQDIEQEKLTTGSDDDILAFFTAQAGDRKNLKTLKWYEITQTFRFENDDVILNQGNSIVMQYDKDYYIIYRKEEEIKKVKTVHKVITQGLPKKINDVNTAYTKLLSMSPCKKLLQKREGSPGFSRPIPHSYENDPSLQRVLGQFELEYEKKQRDTETIIDDSHLGSSGTNVASLNAGLNDEEALARAITASKLEAPQATHQVNKNQNNPTVNPEALAQFTQEQGPRLGSIPVVETTNQLKPLNQEVITPKEDQGYRIKKEEQGPRSGSIPVVETTNQLKPLNREVITPKEDQGYRIKKAPGEAKIIKYLFLPAAIGSLLIASVAWLGKSIQQKTNVIAAGVLFGAGVIAAAITAICLICDYRKSTSLQGELGVKNIANRQGIGEVS